MIELGRIEPFDLEAFLSITTYYGFSAAALNNSVFGNSPERYRADFSFIFSLITPVENNKKRRNN
jgi:hypothetical protein